MQISTEKDYKEIKQHGSYAFPVHISLESIQSYEHGSFIWHWHPEIELTLFLSGQMEYYINDKKYLLSAGEALFCNSNALHAGHMKNGQDCQYVSVTFHPRFLYGYDNSILQTKYVDSIVTNESYSSLVLTKDIKWQADIGNKILEIYQLYQSPPDDYELQIHILLCGIWQKLYQYYASLSSSAPQTPKHLKRLREILSYLQEHYSEDIHLNEIADHIGLCKSECCRFFKKYMKMSIFDYLLFLRVQKSLPLLTQGESVSKAAGMVGFSSPAYFGQIFKRYMGCSPSQYKKKHTSPKS